MTKAELEAENKELKVEVLKQKKQAQRLREYHRTVRVKEITQVRTAMDILRTVLKGDV